MELIIFDFDHTIIDKNVDTYINRMAPNGKIPEHIKLLYNNEDWTPYMREIFKYLHHNGVTKEDYQSCLEEIELVPGFETMFKKLRDNENFHVVIISDANSVFIDMILKHAGVRDAVKEIFTNPAEFDSQGCLTLDEFHFQDWCVLSSRNLCKGYILDTFLEKQKQIGIVYSRISYVGDGSNDYCPTLRLREQDIVFPRKGYELIRKIAINPQCVKAKICPWESGSDVINILNI